MPIKAPTLSKKEHILVPSGNHVATMYRIMNLGTRFQTYKGEKKPYPDTLVNFTFELPNEMADFPDKDEEGKEIMVKKPLVITREFTLSMGPKSNLKPFVEGIIGTTLSEEEAPGFDLEQLLGLSCLINVIHKKSADGTKTFANIKGASPLLKGMEKPRQINENSVFDVNVATLEEINALPMWLRDKVKVSDEYRERFGGEEAPSIGPDGIPF